MYDSEYDFSTFKDAEWDDLNDGNAGLLMNRSTGLYLYNAPEDIANKVPKYKNHIGYIIEYNEKKDEHWREIHGIGNSKNFTSKAASRRLFTTKSFFSITAFNDGEELYEENLSPGIVGLVVDYMTRYAINNNVNHAFKISYYGALALDSYTGNDSASKNAKMLMSNIDGINDISIKNACKLVGYDVFFNYCRSFIKYFLFMVSSYKLLI